VPLQHLRFKPGISREATSLTQETGWFECDKIRFRSGMPEKLGGWVLDTGSLASGSLLPPTGTVWGVARSMHNWLSLTGKNLLGVGTSFKYYIQDSAGGIYYDVTPIRRVGDPVTFTATSSSTTLVVSDTTHGAEVGDFVTFSGVVGLSGQTFTVTIASPAVLTVAGTSFTLTNGQAVLLSTTGALPTGLNTTTTYYVVNAAGVTCNLSLTPGGAAINTSGTQTGTHAIELNAGITKNVLNAEFRVTAVTTNSYTITSPVAALGADTSNGDTLGTAAGAYQITVGAVGAATSFGWGTGGWGGVTSGLPSTGWGASASGGGVTTQLRLWSQANYGENLFINPRGGPIYYWVVNAPSSIYNRARVLQNGNTATQTTTGSITAQWWDADAAPSTCNQVLVSDERFVFAFGCNDPNAADPTLLDPLLIRWSDQENYLTWAPAITNQAGSYRLSTGSEIVTARQTRQEILVWTDAALYALQYLGPPFVWGAQIMGANISIAGPNTTTTANNVTYWMGVDKFYMYSGQVQTLPCSVRQYVFGDINLEQAFQFCAGTNEGFNEVWWFYCSAGSMTNDRYVVFNYLDQVWYYGNLSRTAWLDSAIRDVPMAMALASGSMETSSLLYHETGVDDGSTNPPSPIHSYVQSADFDIGDGDRMMFVWQMVPDITFDGSTSVAPQVTLTLKPRNNPGALYGPTTVPPVISANNYAVQQNYLVQQFTQLLNTRVRGRQMAFKIESNNLGTQWQSGVTRINARPDGRR
jgi:hypothetical protein